MEVLRLTVDGGTVSCIEGTRIWVRVEEDDDGRDVLILLRALTGEKEEAR